MNWGWVSTWHEDTVTLAEWIGPEIGYLSPQQITDRLAGWTSGNCVRFMCCSIPSRIEQRLYTNCAHVTVCTDT